MHRALFVDEILRDIFKLCFECTHETKPNLGDLCRVARCCKTWKDPALDILWGRLSCVEPLLDLVPGLSKVNGVYVCDPYNDPTTVNISSFRSYAVRVKHITLRKSIRMHPVVLSLLALPGSSESIAHILPSLTTVRISYTGCSSFQPSLIISKKLTCLYLDVGFKRRSPQKRDSLKSSETDHTVGELLDQVARVAPTIQRISLRGRVFAGLGDALSSMTQLRVLSLRNGNSLTPDVLATVSSLPLLTELEVHTGYIKAEELDAALPSRQCFDTDNGFFPSLRKLHVRGHTCLIEHILGPLSSEILHVLYIEAEDLGAVTWDIIFALIAAKAAYSLEVLTINHHIDLDEDTPPPHPTIATLGPLAPLRNLRRFTFDTSPPPDLCNDDIAHLATWWPMIEHLNLGYVDPILDCTPQDEWRPRATFASLTSFAKCCPRLATLSLPIDVRGFDFNGTVDICQKAMQQLIIGSREWPHSDDVMVARYLRRLFPALSGMGGAWRKCEVHLTDASDVKQKES